MQMKDIAVAIIFARGGSKRIPHKNIKPFKGQPIIGYPIQSALNSKCFEHVVVSTDSKEIGDIAKKFGAHVPFFRGEKSSHDKATTFDAVVDSLELFQEKYGFTPSTLCLMYATSVFISSDELKTAWNQFRASNLDSMITLSKHLAPPQRGLVMKNGKVDFWLPENAQKRSQDLEEIYFDAAQFYFVKAEALLKEKKILTEKSTSLILKNIYVQDIDNEEDWMIAELKYGLKNGL